MHVGISNSKYNIDPTYPIWMAEINPVLNVQCMWASQIQYNVDTIYHITFLPLTEEFYMKKSWESLCKVRVLLLATLCSNKLNLNEYVNNTCTSWWRTCPWTKSLQIFSFEMEVKTVENSPAHTSGTQTNLTTVLWRHLSCWLRTLPLGWIGGQIQAPGEGYLWKNWTGGAGTRVLGQQQRGQVTGTTWSAGTNRSSQ